MPELQSADDSQRHNLESGYVLLARAIEEGSLVTMRSDDFKVAIICMSKANWKSRKWFDGERDVIVPRGSFITSIRLLSEKVKLSERKVRTALSNLEKANFVTRKATHRWTLVTVVHYDYYQNQDNYKRTESDTRPTQHRHSSDTRPTTTKALKHSNIEKQDKTKGSGKISVPKSLDTPEFRKSWGDFATHRKQLKKKVTALTAEKLMKKLESWGPSRAVAAIEHSIASGWTGVFEEPGQQEVGESYTQQVQREEREKREAENA